MRWYSLILMFFTASSYALPKANCDIKNSQIKINYHLKTEVIKHGFCFNPTTFHLYSKNCLNEKCGVLRKLQSNEKRRSHYMKENANPAFLKCKDLGAIPQIVTVVIGKKTYETDRCFDPSDKSYIHTGYLFD